MVQDPEKAKELAAAQLDDSRPKEPWSPRVADFDLKAAMMREVLGKLDAIQQAVIASAGGHPKRSKPFPMPRTEIEKAKLELEKEFVGDIIGMFGFNPSDFV